MDVFSLNLFIFEKKRADKLLCQNLLALFMSSTARRALTPAGVSPRSSPPWGYQSLTNIFEFPLTNLFWTTPRLSLSSPSSYGLIWSYSLVSLVSSRSRTSAERKFLSPKILDTLHQTLNNNNKTISFYCIIQVNILSNYDISKKKSQ